MRRLLSLTVLVAFAWLQTYQLCDAGEDTIEAVEASNAIAAEPHAVLTAPATPDNEAEEQIPSIFDSSLRPDTILVSIPLMPSAVFLGTGLGSSISPLAVVSTLRGLSPPGPVFLFVASLRSLAPPAA
jgi:hypothetical protein